MAKWEEMRFDILRDYYIAAQRRLKWAVDDFVANECEKRRLEMEAEK